MCHLAFLLLAAALPTAPASQSPRATAAAGPPEDPAVVGAPQVPAAGWRWGDVNGDGLRDLLALDGQGVARVLLNRGDGGFDDVTEATGLARLESLTPGAPLADVAWVDLDGDGRLDLFARTLQGEVRFQRQQPGGTFAGVTAELGLDALTGISGASFEDYDLDGRPDLQLRSAEEERLYHNTRLGFVEVLRLERGPETGAGHPAGAWIAPDAGGAEGSDLPAVPVPGPSTRSKIGGAGPIHEAQPGMLCETSIQDTAMPSNCLQASTTPTAGMLFPLGQRLFVEAGTGNVGIGTLAPVEKLQVEGGSIQTDAQLISTATMGAPLVVASSEKVVGLNVDQLDGLDASNFSQLGSAIETGELANEAVTTDKLGPGAVTSEKISAGAVGTSQIGPLALNDTHVAPMAGIDGSKVDPQFTQTITTLGSLGVGVAAPLATVHAVGSPTLGSMWICPSETGSGADSELLLAEDDNGTFGVKMKYNATDNRLELWGRADDADASEPTLVVERDSGKMSIGNNGNQVGQLTVNGSADTGSYAVEVLAGAGPGIHVTNSSTSDACVLAESIGAGVPAIEGIAASYGVSGESTSSAAAGAGVYGLASPTTGSSSGVQGVTHSSAGNGVLGQCLASSGVNYGVSGSSSSSSGRGVAGFAFSGTGLNYGVRGFTASAAGFGVFASGDLGASGVKSFLQPHPEDPSKEIRFICLEGNEAGTYFRGSGRLAGRRARIPVPEEFRLVSEREQVTVQLTPRGPGSLWVESQDEREIVVAGTGDLAFDYLVNGVRRGFKDLPLVRENASFVPTERGVPFGTQYPEGLRRVLVENGILNPDGTPNEATAASMGWPLVGASTTESDR